jgi:hypothetical protein
MEVAYRFLWNLGDFLFVRRTVFRTADLDPLLFESNRARLRIDAAKAAATRSMDPLASGQPVPAQHADGPFQTVIGFLKPLVWNPVVFVLLAFSIFVMVCNRNEEIEVLLILVLVWAGQVGLTLFAVNALYDRGCVPLRAWDGARRNGTSFLSQRRFLSAWRYFSSLEQSSPGSFPSSTARSRDCRLPTLLSINRPS